MRILVLHPAASSSECMRELLAPLAGALAARHGIALAYTDAPLLYQGGRENENAGQAGDGRSRSWFEAVPFPAPRDGDGDGDIESSPRHQFVGLDASILHLSQIWMQRAHTDPFSGILALGQGAAVAALLPLLVQPGGAQGVARDEGVARGAPLFPGLDFVVLVDGYDLTDASLSYQDGSDDEDGCALLEPEPCFGDHLGPRSLHMVGGGGDGNRGGFGREAMAARLAVRFGPSGRIHRLAAASIAGISLPPRGPEGAPACPFDDNGSGVVGVAGRPFRKRDLNVIGRFLVEQKNTAGRVERRLNRAAGRSSQVVARDRERLALLEHVAGMALVEHVEANPPKALMAVIAPGAVGGWSGDRRRDFGSEGGGAPCPQKFVLREEDRREEEGRATGTDP